MATMISNFVNAFKKEGVDHIRINSFAESHIGRVLSKNWRATFFIPGIGEFTSPMCFANWILSGDEDARHNVRFRYEKPSRDFNKLVLFAKYFQLCKLAHSIRKHHKDLPYVAYKTHVNGLKEFDTWKEYPVVIKAMVDHIVDPNKGPKVKFDWSVFDANIEELVQSYIKNLVTVEETEEDTKEETVAEETQSVVSEEKEAEVVSEAS